jgi:hypothetical protein
VQVLLLHLTRHARGLVRLGHRITFPPTLHCRPGSEPYNFTGALLHDGQSQQSGHYIHITRCVVTGRLFYCSDDSPPKLVDPQLMHEVEACVYVLVYSLEGATREAAAQLRCLGLPGAGQQEVLRQSGHEVTSGAVHEQGTETCSGNKRRESFTPRQRAKLQMTAAPSGCPECAAHVDGHECQDDQPSLWRRDSEAPQSSRDPRTVRDKSRSTGQQSSPHRHCSPEPQENTDQSDPMSGGREQFPRSRNRDQGQSGRGRWGQDRGGQRRGNHGRGGLGQRGRGREWQEGSGLELGGQEQRDRSQAHAGGGEEQRGPEPRGSVRGRRRGGRRGGGGSRIAHQLHHNNQLHHNREAEHGRRDRLGLRK